MATVRVTRLRAAAGPASGATVRVTRVQSLTGPSAAGARVRVTRVQASTGPALAGGPTVRVSRVRAITSTPITANGRPYVWRNGKRVAVRVYTWDKTARQSVLIAGNPPASTTPSGTTTGGSFSTAYSTGF